MNAITRFVADSSLPVWDTTPVDTRGTDAHRTGPQADAGWRVEEPTILAQSGRIPVFRNDKPCGFIERRDDPSVTAAAARTNRFGLPNDVWNHLNLADIMHGNPWITADRAGIAVKNGVARLLGQADSTHDVLALRRIAAAIPGATAIIDDLWVPYD